MIETCLSNWGEDSKRRTIRFLPEESGHPMPRLTGAEDLRVPVNGPQVTIMNKNWSLGNGTLFRDGQYACI